MRITERPAVHLDYIRRLRNHSPWRDVAATERGARLRDDARELTGHTKRETQRFFNHGMLEQDVLALLGGGWRVHKPNMVSFPAPPSLTAKWWRPG